MRRFLSWLIGLPIVIIFLGFAVANRQWTQLSLDPFNGSAPTLFINLPLWLLFILGIVVGVVIGWFSCWRAQAKWRRLARERAKEITRLQSEVIVARKGPEKVEAQMLSPLPGFMP